jgi:hypothetical protein
MALLTQTPEQYYNGSEFGGYQYITLADLINNFIIAYVGDDKIINAVKRTEVAFHAQRALQELSYDTLKSVKSIELEVPPSLSIKLPQDYVNYTQISFVDDGGLEQLVLPNRLSSTPLAPLQDESYNFLFDINGNLLLAAKSETESRWQNATNIDSSLKDTNVNFLEEGYGFNVDYGKRYGITPEYTTKNGAFYIDDLNGRISFSADFNGRIITLKYISDSLATEGEMRVHKLAEEAVYKHIAYAVISNKQDAPEYRVQRLKKERRAATRNAKLRLNNIKIKELEQIMRGKSKQIKH